MSKTLFYSPYGSWYLHTLYDITIGHGIKVRNGDVKFIGCDALYSDCDVHWEATSPRTTDSCNICRNVSSQVFKEMQLDVDWLGKYLPADFDENSLSYIDELTEGEFFDFEYQGYPVGVWVKSSVHSHFRINFIDLNVEHIRKTYVSYIKSGIKALLCINRLLDEYQADNLVMLNGRFFSHRIFLELAKQRGIRTLVHERGLRDNTLALWENESCHSYQTSEKSWIEWKDIPLSEQQLDDVTRVLKDRERGLNTGWKSFVLSGSKKTGLDEEFFSNRKTITLFTSSDDEMAASEGWSCVMEQMDWVARTINYVQEHPDYNLIIRIHPNTSGILGSNKQSLDQFRQVTANLPDNVRVVWPEDEVNSYAILAKTDFALVYSSTVSLEAAARGLPVLMTGGGRLFGKPYTWNLTEAHNYEAELQQFLQSAMVDVDKVKYALRYVYHSYFRMSLNFPLVQVVDVHHANVTYQTLDPLLPGKDDTLDRVCEFLLSGKSIYSMPDDHITGNVEHENAVAANVVNEKTEWLHRASGSADKKVSVVITCFNYEKYVSEAIQSIVDQTYQNIEIVIVNDGSTDKSLEVIKESVAANPSCNMIIVDQENSGQPAISRNNGIKKASGDYILPLDADDKLSVDFVEQCVDVLNNHEDVDIVYTDRKDFDGADQVVLAGDYNFNLLKYQNHISYCGMYRRDVWLDVGGYRTNVRGCEDWDFWIAAGAKGHFGKRIAEPLFLYRRHDTGVYQDALKDFDKISARIVLNNASVYKKCDIQNALATLELKDYMLELASPLPAEPLVTVIVTTCDRPFMLRDALCSINNQLYKNIEIIVVDEGRIPSASIVEQENRLNNIRYIRHRRPLGPAAARNTAIRVMSGDLVCFLDDDDMFHTQHLSTIVNEFLSGDYSIVYTDSQVLSETIDGQRRQIVANHGNAYAHDDYSRDKLLVTNYIPVNTFACRAECIDIVGEFDESLPSLEDWEYLVRLSRYFVFKHVPTITVDIFKRANILDDRSRQNQFTFYQVHEEIHRRSLDLCSEEVKKVRANYLLSLQGNTLPEKDAHGDYELWKEIHALKQSDMALLETKLSQWALNPSFHIVVRVNDNNFDYLPLTIHSLNSQLYSGWGVSIVSEVDYQPDFIRDYENIEWLTVETDFRETAQQTISDTGADWIMLMDSGDCLQPLSLFYFAENANKYPDKHFIYSDHDVIDTEGATSAPVFKSDFNIELLKSMPYMGNACVFSGKVFNLTGELPAYNQHLLFALAFEVLAKFGHSVFSHVSEVLYHRSEFNQLAELDDEAENSCRLILEKYIASTGQAVKVSPGYKPLSYRWIYEHQELPLVTIIIPNKDSLDIFKPCLESIFSKTAYQHYEVIVVDNASVEKETFEYYAYLETRPNIRIITFADEFNYSAMNNLAAKHASGDYLVLLNNDTQVLQENWLERLLNHAQRDEIGIVGARLFYPDNSVQHIGVVTGMQEVAGHPYVGTYLEDVYDTQYFCDRNVSAVTGACMMIRKSVFDEVNGLDSDELKVSYNDVDLCLKVSNIGYQVIVTPFVNLLHHGSYSQKKAYHSYDYQKRFEAEQEIMLQRWLSQLSSDPFYNRNLSLAYQDNRPETYIEYKWSDSYLNLPKVLGIPLLFGAAGMYRVYAPLSKLHQAAKIEFGIVSPQERQTTEIYRIPTVSELERSKADCLLMQSLVQDKHFHNLERYKKFSNVFKVYDLEDLKTFVPDKNSMKQYMVEGLGDRVIRALSLSDRLLVTTDPLAEAHRTHIDDIRVVPNYLPKGMWQGLVTKKRQGSKPRVGWAGAQQHHGDLEIIIDVVKQTAHEVDWIFMGMCLDELKPYVKEVHEFVDFENYPIKLASLNLDIALAPLEVHQFNEAKSNLRLLEYGILGWPVICTDIYPYQQLDPPVKRVKNNTADWLEALRERVYDLDMAEREGEALRQWVLQNFMLEDHLDVYLDALTP